MLLSKAQRKQFLEICLRKASYPTTNDRGRLRELSTYALPNLSLLTSHAVRGAWAANNYMAPRNTQDIDLLTTETEYQQLLDELELRGYAIEGSLELAPKGRMEPMYVARLINSSVDYPIIDVLTSPDNWVRAALTDATQDPHGNKVLSIPYLVLMKMDARMRDMSDITAILGDADGATLARTKDLVLRYLPNSLDDFANLVLLAKIEAGA